MLKKELRLNLKGSYSFVKSGVKLENDIARIYIKGTNTPASKIGITSPRSIFKQAVDRNRARRLISKGFENLYPRIKAGLIIMALPKIGVLEYNSKKITCSLEKLLEDNYLIPS